MVRFLKLAGAGLLVVAALGALSPLVREAGVDFRFHTSSTIGPAVTGAVLLGLGFWLQARRRTP